MDGTLSTPPLDELTDETGAWGLLESSGGRGIDELLDPRFRGVGYALNWAQRKAREDVRLFNTRDIERGDYVKRRYTIVIQSGILTLGNNETGTIYYTLRPVRVAAWEAMWRRERQRN